MLSTINEPFAAVFTNTPAISTISPFSRPCPTDVITIGLTPLSVTLVMSLGVAKVIPNANIISLSAPPVAVTDPWKETSYSPPAIDARVRVFVVEFPTTFKRSSSCPTTVNESIIVNTSCVGIFTSTEDAE